MVASHAVLIFLVVLGLWAVLIGVQFWFSSQALKRFMTQKSRSGELNHEIDQQAFRRAWYQENGPRSALFQWFAAILCITAYIFIFEAFWSKIENAIYGTNAIEGITFANPADVYAFILILTAFLIIVITTSIIVYAVMRIYYALLPPPLITFLRPAKV